MTGTGRIAFAVAAALVASTTWAKNYIYAGSGGTFWPSVLYSGWGSYASGLGFNSGDHGTNYNSRCFGRSVRPVQGFAE